MARLLTLYSFTGDEDGADPEAGLVQGLDGSFYGTTYAGGRLWPRHRIQITPAARSPRSTRSAGGIDGSGPDAALVQGADGNLYGTTSSGGVGQNGTVFLITPGGAFATLVLFDSTLYGAGSEAGLIVGADGSVYGTAGSGGTNGSGTVFRMQYRPGPCNRCPARERHQLRRHNRHVHRRGHRRAALELPLAARRNLPH